MRKVVALSVILALIAPATMLGKERVSMDSKQIHDLMERFLDPAFGLPEITRLFGQVRTSKPTSMFLEEKFDNVEPVHLLRRGPDHPSAGFITDIVLSFKKPFRLSVSKLSEVYGPAHELPSDPKLGADRKIEFDVKGKALVGRLFISLTRAQEPLVSEVHLRRLTPQPQ